MPTIEIYTQLFCPFCARAVNLLTRKGVTSAAREEARARSGGRTSVPQIFIDGRHIGGSDDLTALDRAGKLDPLLAA